MEKLRITYPLPLKILGMGHYVPERIVSSGELERRCGLQPGWIEAKQGVKERRWVVDETNSEMGAADRKSTRLNSSHSGESRMPSSA